MTEPARRLLSLLGMLPDGIAREDLTELLPDSALAAATVLRQLGLAFGEAGRLRTLAPIREHVAASYPPDPVDLDRAVDHYARLAVTGGQVGRSDGARTAARLQADTGNIAALLECAAAGRRTAELSDAVTGLAEYWRFTGLVQPALAAIAEQAIETHGTPSQQAATWLALGFLARDRSDLDTAQAQYERAQTLFQQIGDVLGEANCIQGLGDVAREQCDNDEARTQALALYQAVRDPHSAGWTLVGLARLDSAGGERARHWQAAQEAWASIGRDDLIESVRAEFE
jgi:tetratricopeptide (TPR) repeat protein